MAAESVFVDTNVLVYTGRPNSLLHTRARNAIDRLQDGGRSLWISGQVVREYLAVVTRAQVGAPAVSMAQALVAVRDLRSLFNMAGEGERVLNRLLDLLASYPGSGKQVHDANLIATMLEAGIRRLLTFNTRDFQRFGELIVLEPL